MGLAQSLRDERKKNTWFGIPIDGTSRSGKRVFVLAVGLFVAGAIWILVTKDGLGPRFGNLFLWFLIGYGILLRPAAKIRTLSQRG